MEAIAQYISEIILIILTLIVGLAAMFIVFGTWIGGLIFWLFTEEYRWRGFLVHCVGWILLAAMLKFLAEGG